MNKLEEIYSVLSPEQISYLQTQLKKPKIKKAYNWQHFECNAWSGEGAIRDTGRLPDIRCRFDYFSAVWENHTLFEVLEFYQLTPYFEQILKTKAFRDQFKTDELVRLSFNNIVISVPYSCIVRCNPAFLHEDVGDAFHRVDVQNMLFPRLIISMSGQALEWMRGEHINVEKILRLQPDVEHRFHVTRIDTAFDFKNYKYEFLLDAMEFLQTPECLTEKGRLLVSGAGQPLSFSIKRGLGEIIYIGKSTSDRLLRIYDKKLEQTKEGCFSSWYWGDPKDVLSWLRIEWQLRGSKATQMLYNTSDTYWLYILKEMYAFYSFRDLSQSYESFKNAPIAEFWQDFWDFDMLGKRYDEIIGENGHLVQLVDSDPLREKLKRYLKQSVRKHALAYYVFRDDKYKAIAYDYFLTITQPRHTPEAERVRQKTLYAFICLLNSHLEGNIEEFVPNGILIFPEFGGAQNAC